MSRASCVGLLTDSYDARRPTSDVRLTTYDARRTTYDARRTSKESQVPQYTLTLNGRRRVIKFVRRKAQRHGVAPSGFAAFSMQA